MESMTKRTAVTIAHIQSLKRADYTNEEFYLIVLNAVQEYVPSNIVEVYEELLT